MNKPMPTKGRNAAAMSACFMKAGSFHHKCAPRGGSHNDMSDFLAEYEEDKEILAEVDQSTSEN